MNLINLSFSSWMLVFSFIVYSVSFSHTLYRMFIIQSLEEGGGASHIVIYLGYYSPANGML